jgi:hypothetical protein
LAHAFAAFGFTLRAAFAAPGLRVHHAHNAQHGAARSQLAAPSPIPRKSAMTYRINHRSEETACSECGCPLYVGEMAYTDDCEREVYCSAECQTEAENYWKREE